MGVTGDTGTVERFESRANGTPSHQADRGQAVVWTSSRSTASRRPVAETACGVDAFDHPPLARE